MPAGYGISTWQCAQKFKKRVTIILIFWDTGSQFQEIRPHNLETGHIFGNVGHIVGKPGYIFVLVLAFFLKFWSFLG